MNSLVSWVLFPLAFLSGCVGLRPEADLLITNVTVFDSRAGIERPGMTVSVKDGLISRVGRADSLSGIQAERAIDGRGRLLIPGLIDAHSHSVNVLATSFNPGGGGIVDLSMQPDSIAHYRRIFQRAYLPYGVTVVRDAGSSDEHLPTLKAWGYCER